MEAIFHAPKRRLKVYESFEAPLPVLLSEDLDSDQIEIYKAEIVNQHVIVKEREHIPALYGKGFFGKGVLSRSRPVHSLSERWEYVGDKCLPVISLEKYQKHVRWAHAALLAQGLDEEAVGQVLKDLTHPIPLDLTEEHEEAQEQDAAEIPSGPMEGVSIEKSAEVSEPRRQEDPRFDPLAELDPQEVERVDPNQLAQIKCTRHDDRSVRCGCRLDEGETPSASGTQSCDTSVAHGYVLVEEPGDGEPEQDEANSDRKCRLVCRINPFNMVEYLQLSYEEAFFLVYALGCLSVSSNREPLSILQVWNLFRLAQPNFEMTYAAYHYFRSKGWVPKCGIKYGTNLLLYRKGPPFYHASYSVVVERVDETFQGSTLRPFSWRSLAALNRTTSNVSKELMLCYVIVPSDAQDFSSPEFLHSVKVQEIIVSRWVSSKDRTEQDDV